MADQARNDITINGGGSIAGGSYETVTINGGGNVSGDLVCTALRINGMGSCAGQVKTASLSVNGTGSFQGAVQAGEMSVNGDASVRAGLGVNQLSVRGNLTVDGGIAMREIDLKGVVRAQGDITGEALRGEGRLEAGNVKVDTVDLAVYGPSRLTSIEAARITLRSPGSLAEILAMFTNNSVTLERMRAGEIWAELTVANVVSAGNITVGKDSRIGLVEYSGTYSAQDGAKVTEARKVEAG
jgi:cytoskeletal protein CcmA (bactofilin family)